MRTPQTDRQFVLLVCCTACCVFLSAICSGCGNPAEPPVDAAEDPLQQVVALSQDAGRGAAAHALILAIDRQTVTFDGAFAEADAMLDRADPSAPLFAGVVLHAAEKRWDGPSASADSGVVATRLGRLAARATLAAHKAGDPDLADELVLAGSELWQSADYWRQHPEHDTLVAITLAHQGKHADAITRLESRETQTSETLAAIEEIRNAEREALRARLRERLAAEQAAAVEPPSGG